MFEAEYRKFVRNGMAILGAVGVVAIIFGVQYGLVENHGRFFFVFAVGFAVVVPVVGFALITAYYLAYANLASKGNAEEEFLSDASTSQPTSTPPARPSAQPVKPRPPLFPPRRTDVETFPRRGP